MPEGENPTNEFEPEQEPDEEPSKLSRCVESEVNEISKKKKKKKNNQSARKKMQREAAEKEKYDHKALEAAINEANEAAINAAINEKDAKGIGELTQALKDIALSKDRPEKKSMYVAATQKSYELVEKNMTFVITTGDGETMVLDLPELLAMKKAGIDINLWGLQEIPERSSSKEESAPQKDESSPPKVSMLGSMGTCAEMEKQLIANLILRGPLHIPTLDERCS
jgi:NADH dehydrogenase/NADH:ubiquinone oxidoreductase subunit G